MPPKRRTSGPAQTRNSAQQQSQQRISFGKGAPNRVTKPTAVRDSKKVSKKGLASLDIITPSANQDTAQADELIAEPTTAEKAIQEQVQTELQDPLAKEEGSKVEDVLGGRAQDSELGAVGGKSGSGWVGEEEVEARKVTETRIKAYWRAKERERKAPRVHQEGLTVGEKVLREWDMSGQYGPCIGIARLKRWKRANMLGLNPPIEVLAVLLKGVDEGDSKMQRAHVDELMSSRFIET